MREIKFRVWEKNLKEIIPVYDIDFKNRMINTGILWKTFDEVELMQFTGLKDKNGKEIYEGDILRDHGEEGAFYEYPFYIEYSKERGSFDFVDKFDYYFGIARYTAFQISCERVEVIGNIYENPELLERAVESE